ncbi:MAG: hypothetical protein V1793_05465 [Pseudomonadota bacterium]
MTDHTRCNPSLAVISGAFVLSQAVNLFLPRTPIWDENLFFPVVRQFGEHYLPTLDLIRTMDSPMGPVYFCVYGFLGKLVGFSLPAMRAVHLCFSLLLMMILWRFLSQCKRRDVLILCFILNPYFMVMTGPLLYTDVLGLLFAYLGASARIQGKNPWLAGFLWGMAICTRQLLVVIPLAAGISDLYSVVIEKKQSWKTLIPDLMPCMMFLPLFCLWGFNVNSGTFHAGAFEENRVQAFSFSLRSLNYSIMLTGLYSLPILYGTCLKRLRRPGVKMAVLAVILCICAFPTDINRDMLYGHLPRTAGLLDISLNRMSFLAYGAVPVLMYWGLNFLYEVMALAVHSKDLFLPTCTIVFILLESVYSYCWDKHFLVIIPIVFLLSDRILSSRDTGCPDPQDQTCPGP